MVNSNNFIDEIVVLKEREIESISQLSLKFNYAIYKLYQNDLFWKKRIESILGYSLPSKQIDWYDLYTKIYDRQNDRPSDLTDKAIETLLNSYELKSDFYDNFPTGNEDIDLKILFDVDDLNKIVFLYNESRIIRLMLDKPKVFLKIKERYHLYSGYINSFRELSILEKELKKTNVNNYMNWDAYDFQPGNRIILPEFSPIHSGTNFVITDRKLATNRSGREIDTIVFHEVDLFGNRVNINDRTGMLHVLKTRGYWYDSKHGTHVHSAIRPGIVLFSGGPEISNINSLLLKYKTFSKDNNVAPEINMMVTAWIEGPLPYAIVKVSGNILFLQYLGKNPKLSNRIVVSQYDSSEVTSRALYENKLITLTLGDWEGLFRDKSI